MFVRREQPSPALNPHGGRFGLPADFLITTTARFLPVNTALCTTSGRLMKSSNCRESAMLTADPARNRFDKGHQQRKV
jgi:hypothetical protein